MSGKSLKRKKVLGSLCVCAMPPLYEVPYDEWVTDYFDSYA